ncbi:MAG: zinc ribbon domain-containing protein, partial [Promethearchaeota archaeon]
MKVKDKWILICISGGILMLIGSASGFAILFLILGLYSEYGATYLSSAIGAELTTVLTVLITLLLVIMAGGGISVIIGAILIYINMYKLGKIIIALGTGMGLFGIIMFLIWEASFVNPVNTLTDFGFFLLSLLLNFYFIGVLMAFIAKKKMKKLTDEEYGEVLMKEAVAKHDKEVDKLYERVKCPVCNTENPKTGKFCRKCG